LRGGKLHCGKLMREENEIFRPNTYKKAILHIEKNHYLYNL
jgi:predicted nucleic-acid-binding Zn-ribbon protein